mmetsp:Transcript_1031/g.1708  ORF Transcript_1031/g.1708 Transcript_1031/m.1708 type:complete len:153 (-) Transcript_1031:1071-1529(-)
MSLYCRQNTKRGMGKQERRGSTPMPRKVLLSQAKSSGILISSIGRIHKSEASMIEDNGAVAEECHSYMLGEGWNHWLAKKMEVSCMKSIYWRSLRLEKSHDMSAAPRDFAMNLIGAKFRRYRRFRLIYEWEQKSPNLQPQSLNHTFDRREKE